MLSWWRASCVNLLIAGVSVELRLHAAVACLRRKSRAYLPENGPSV
nr:MAG TPA: hypothetical protein [Caudoviricetes sp.]DAO84344.1 MAG TPA: hypothetical protein [Caudoviricetes sp.]